MNAKDTKIASTHGLSDEHTTAYLLMVIINMQCDFSALSKVLKGTQKERCLDGWKKARKTTQEFIPLFEEAGSIDILQTAAEVQGLELFWHKLLSTTSGHEPFDVNVHHGTDTVNS